jgi:GntR family transcriptional regulator, transcriptional repressor for pyruvate dehydrogenase complex
VSAPDVSSADPTGGARSRFRGKTIASSTAAEQIARQLRTALLTGHIRPMERLGTEPAMAQDFGVSRATVREAIRILRGQGIVQTRRGAKGGHFLVSPQTDVLAESVGESLGLWFDAGTISVAEVDEARNIVEGACVRLAAERRSEAHLAEMAAVLRGSAQRPQSLAAFLEFDVRFHGTIARAAQNRLLELPMTAIHKVRSRTNRLLRQHDRPVVIEQHTRIFEAIRDRDPDGAERAFLDHAHHIAREREAAAGAGERSASEIVIGELSEVDEEDPA